jgi:hypothetical protein
VVEGLDHLRLIPTREWTARRRRYWLHIMSYI